MAFADPQSVLTQFGIAEGMRVADFGAGSGFYTLAAARKVGEEGKVYAVDIQKETLSALKTHIQDQALDNVEVVWGDLEEVGGSSLEDASVNVVLVSNMLFQVEDSARVLAEAYRVLRPGGRVLVVEWSESFGGLGPHTDHVVTEETVRDALETVGFTITGDIAAGAHHYGIAAKKSL